jgi:death-on-curing protein
MNPVIFIPKEFILLFHAQLIQTYGGSLEIIDQKLLDSALAQPKSTFQGKFLYDSLIKMAAAYGYFLCKNHPFVDGNKRVALIAMEVFLHRNGYEITATEKDIFKIMMLLASGDLPKDELVDWLLENTAST